MSGHDEHALRARAAAHGQEHIFRFWAQLDAAQRDALLAQVAGIDFDLMERLIDTWVRQEPPAEAFEELAPVPTLPIVDPAEPGAQAARDAGEAALRAGRVGMVLVAGGQGTRLGFEGPKGAYPIGPITGKTIFAYHAEKILNLQRRYGCVLPWYIMVSDANRAETERFFREHQYFGLRAEDIVFFTQRMVPCVDADGRFLLETPGRLCENPNGHGGCIPALVENGILDHAASRGVDTLTYFQVDNWAVKVADPYFLGYHLQNGGEMSSKVHRKTNPRESVGVHCLCDGEYRVIEYSELDIYPQLLETEADGSVRYYAGNPAIHVIDTGFIRRVYDNYDHFPWHRAHKKIPHVDSTGAPVKPEAPNGYKFETFIFDALRYTRHAPIALEIRASGEYTPIKQYDGPNSVLAARRSQSTLWAGWLAAAGHAVPTDANAQPVYDIEISPRFALTQDEFVARAEGHTWPTGAPLAIGPEGELEV